MRIELGPRDLEAGTALVSQRIGEGKEAVALDAIAAGMQQRLDDYHNLLLDRARAFREDRTRTVDTWDDFGTQVQGGFAWAWHCGSGDCEGDIKEATQATARLISADAHDGAPGACIRCGDASGYQARVLFGKSY